MRLYLIGFMLLAFQMSSLQEMPAIHLQPNRNRIEANFGGKLLELVNAPPVVSLPNVPPKVDGEGLPWRLDVKNLGPSMVTVIGVQGFSVDIKAGSTVHIVTSRGRYTQKF
jgi:hypothetical protein